MAMLLQHSQGAVNVRRMQHRAHAADQFVGGAENALPGFDDQHTAVEFFRQDQRTRRHIRKFKGDGCGFTDGFLDFGVVPGFADKTEHFAVIDRADDRRQIGIAGQQDAHGMRRNVF